MPDMRRIVLCVALAGSLGSSFASGATGAAAASARKARVATGAEVTLVPSARTAAQWSAKRPHYRELLPKVRGTYD